MGQEEVEEPSQPVLRLTAWPTTLLLGPTLTHYRPPAPCFYLTLPPHGGGRGRAEKEEGRDEGVTGWRGMEGKGCKGGRGDGVCGEDWE